MKQITEQMIKNANRNGLEDKANGVEYTTGDYCTPVLSVALKLGWEGIDITECPVVSGYRFGEIPECGISMNWADQRSERGVSLAALDGCKEIGSSIWFCSRKKVNVTGVLLPYKGSDGEPLVLPIGIDCWDN